MAKKTYGKFETAEANKPPKGMYVPIEFPQLGLVDTRTRDGRLIVGDGFEPFELPRSIKLKTVDAPGHDGAVPTGVLQQVDVDENGVVSGLGWLADDPEGLGRKSAFLVRTKVLKGNSMDLSVKQEDVDIRYIEENGKFRSEIDFNAAMLKGTTLLTEPAFEDAGAVIPEDWHVEGFDEPAGLVASVKAAEAMDEDATEHAFAFTVLSERPKVKADLFEDPKMTELMPVFVDEGEHVFGYIAAWNQEHLSHPGVYPPRSQTNYGHFANKSVLTTEGMVAVGNLVQGGGHASENLGMVQALDWYANNTAVWADVAVGEDERGIWVSGMVRPGTSDIDLHAARASTQSGDWRWIGASQELILSLSVNAGAFSIARPRTFGHEPDRPLTILGAGMIPPRAASAPAAVAPEVAYLATRFATAEAADIVAGLSEFDDIF